MEDVLSRTNVDQGAGASLAHRIAGRVDNRDVCSAGDGGAVGLMRFALEVQIILGSGQYRER